ncbi:MAG: hypothetical protein HY903_19115 [Deltaproteobacteria bacterium]|nr:hypothetical protein [Deltaproteobacteria bacterium]
MTPVLLALLFGAAPDQLGFSAAGAATAGAAVAEPAGASGAYYNPAHAALAADAAAVVGYGRALRQVTLDGARQSLAPVDLVSLGLSIPARLPVLGRFGLSFAVTMPGSRILVTDVVPAGRPRLLFDANRLECTTIDVGLAYARTVGDIELAVATGAAVLTDAAGNGTTFYFRRSDAYAQADAAVEVELPVAMAPTVAALGRAGDWSFAAVFRAALEMDVQIGTSAEMTIGPFAGDLQAAVSGTDFYTPARLVLGATWRHVDLSLHLAAEYQRWRAAPPLTATWRTRVEPEGVPVVLPQSTPVPQRLDDVVVGRLAVEQRWPLRDQVLTLRAGGFYAPTPVGRDAWAVFVDSDHFGVGLGLGLDSTALAMVLPRPLSLDLHLLYVGLRDHRQTFAGVAGEVPIRIAGRLWSGGLGLTLRL